MPYTGNTLRKAYLDLNILGGRSALTKEVFVRLGEVGATTIRVRILDDVNLTGYTFGFEALLPGKALIQDDNQDNFRQVSFNEFEYRCKDGFNNFVGTTEYAYFTISKGSTEKVTTQNFYVHSLSNVEEDADFVQENYISAIDRLIANGEDAYKQAVETRSLIDSNEVLTTDDLTTINEKLNEIDTLKVRVASLEAKLASMQTPMTTTEYLTNEQLVQASQKMENNDPSQWGKLLEI